MKPMPVRRSGIGSTYDKWKTRFALIPRKSSYSGKRIWFKKIHIVDTYQIVDGPQLEYFVGRKYYTSKEKLLKLVQNGT